MITTCLIIFIRFYASQETDPALPARRVGCFIFFGILELVCIYAYISLQSYLYLVDSVPGVLVLILVFYSALWSVAEGTRTCIHTRM